MEMYVYVLYSMSCNMKKSPKQVGYLFKKEKKEKTVIRHAEERGEDRRITRTFPTDGQLHVGLSTSA